jgi:hypothetical protein
MLNSPTIAAENLGDDHIQALKDLWRESVRQTEEAGEQPFREEPELSGEVSIRIGSTQLTMVADALDGRQVEQVRLLWREALKQTRESGGADAPDEPHKLGKVVRIELGD